MTLSEFLDSQSKSLGAAALRGAVVLVALERPIDDFIRKALAFGPYHPGKPSPWSHTFLLADAYAGPSTPILDCTIRDPKTGGLLWHDDLLQILASGIDDNGGIYDGRLSDYDDPRITNIGFKIIPSLTDDQRSAVVTAGKHLQYLGYHYDIPGLLRELARLLIGIPIPGGKKLLFCSAFVQAAYRNAIGWAGDFAPKAAADDVTPDDIWYSPLGLGFTPA